MKKPSNRSIVTVLPLLLLAACDPIGEIDRPLFPEADRQHVSQKSRQKVKKVVDDPVSCPTPEEAERKLGDALAFAEKHPNNIPSVKSILAGERAVTAFRDGIRTIVHENHHPNFTYFYIDPKNNQLTYDSSIIGGWCTFDSPNRNLQADARKAMAIMRAKKGKKGKRGKR